MLIGVSQTSAPAELGIQHVGLRAGVSRSPDQFHGGIFLDAGHLVSNLRFQPSLEFGIGNGVRLGAVNLDALYPLAERSWRSWRPYAGGGLGVNFIDVTDGVGEGRGAEIEPCLNIIGGVERDSSKRGSRASRRYVIEARVGVGDTPDFKISAGITFW